MDISSVYKGRPYLFEIEDQPIEESDKLLKAIFQHAKIGFPNVEIKYLDSGDFYDTFSVGDFIVKFSLDSLNSVLENESLALAQIGKEGISFGKFKYGDEISYSIIKKIKGQKVGTIGIGEVLAKTDQFCYSFKNQLNKSTKQTFKKHLMSFLSEEICLTSLPQEVLEAIQDLDLIKTLFKSIESEMLQLSSLIDNDKKFLCHGDLNLDNILVNTNGFDFINWGKSFTGNPYLDLANFVILSGVSDETEKKLFDTFSEVIEEKNLTQGWREYSLCFEFCLRKVLLSSFMAYIKEVYLLGSSNPLNILKNIQIFTKNHKRILKIPSVLNNYKTIYNFLLTPIMGNQ